MTFTIQTRNGPGMNFDMIYPDNIPEIFSEGFGDAMIGNTHVKIALFQVRPVDIQKLKKNEQPIERRQVSAFLSMPLPALVHSFANILHGIAESYEASAAFSDVQRSQVREALAILNTVLPNATKSFSPISIVQSK